MPRGLVVDAAGASDVAAPRVEAPTGFAPMVTPASRRGSALSTALALSLIAHVGLVLTLVYFVTPPRASDDAVEIPVEIVVETPPAAVPPAPPPVAEEAPAPPPPQSEAPPPPQPAEPPPTAAVEPPRAPEPAAPPPAAELEPPKIVALPPPVEHPAIVAPKAPPAKVKPAPKPQAESPAPARAPPAPAKAEAPKADIGAYRASLYQRIYSAVRYPTAARARGVQGVATVNFALDASGRVASATLAQSSGDATLDDDAVATVRRASPLPAPPEGAPRAFVVPIRYRMR